MEKRTPQGAQGRAVVLRSASYWEPRFVVQLREKSTVVGRYRGSSGNPCRARPDGGCMDDYGLLPVSAVLNELLASAGFKKTGIRRLLFGTAWISAS